MIERLKKHWWTIVMAIMSIFGVVFSIYAYIVSKADRNISYVVTNNIEIANRDKSKQGIIINTLNGKEILNNVYLMELSIWNSGNTYLSAQDIKAQIHIRMLSGNIVSASIQKEIMADVAKISLSNAKLACEHTQKNFTEYGNMVPVSWCNFDPGFGVKIVLIYEAEYPSTITVDGYISGISKILDFDRTGLMGKFVENWTLYVIIFTFIIGMLGMMAIIIVKRTMVFLNDKQRFEFMRGTLDAERNVFAMFIAISIIMLITWVYVHLSYSVEPPINII